MMLIGIMSVSACGKKPPHVDPPDVEDSDTSYHFPGTYPNPATDK